MSTRFASAVVRLRHLVVGLWLLVALAATVLLPNIGEAQSGSLGDLVPRDADAIDAEVRANELFGFPLLSRTLVVQRDPDGLSPRAQARVAGRALALNRDQYPGLTGVGGALAVTNALGRPPFSRERSTTAITYLFFPPDIGPVGRRGLSERLIERHISEPEDAVVGPTGAVAARAEQAEVIKDDLPLVEAATLLLVLLAVGLHFRAVGAPLVNVAAIAVAYFTSTRVIAWLGQQIGVSVPSEVEPVIVVLLFGVLTDYAIFFMSRFRRRLEEGRERLEAARTATAELLAIVLTAGLTIVGASSALAVAELGFLQAFGPGMAISVAVGLMVALTLMPALLAIGGERLFWPGGTREQRSLPGRPRSPFARLRDPRLRPSRVATRNPAATVAAVTLVLLALASGLAGLDVGNPLIRGLPEDSPAREAYSAGRQGFTPGILAPTMLVVEGEGIVRQRRALHRLQRLIEDQPGVAEVAGPADVPLQVTLGATLSQTGDAARYVIVFDADPLGSEAIAALGRLQRRMSRLLAGAGLPYAEASFAGDTALVRETVEKTFDDLLRVAPVAFVAVVLALTALLRALVAPLYLVFASTLALCASLGLTKWFFQDALGYGELTYYVPFAAAVLLGALGSDYNVFLVGRIWQEARERPLREAVRVGAGRAAGPIAVAGLILAASFALLALVEIRAFRELAFAMAVGLLIDAFVVRPLLVPALIVLVGERSGWPGRALRRRFRRAATRRESPQAVQ